MSISASRFRRSTRIPWWRNRAPYRRDRQRSRSPGIARRRGCSHLGLPRGIGVMQRGDRRTEYPQRTGGRKDRTRRIRQIPQRQRVDRPGCAGHAGDGLVRARWRQDGPDPIWRLHEEVRGPNRCRRHRYVGRPTLRWKSIRARSVSGPKMPSMRPASNPRDPRRSCSSATSSPRSMGECR